MPTNEELCSQVQKGHDPQGCLEKLYKKNSGLIHQTCMKYGGGEELEDLEQECYFAIETAARRYDPDAGSTFAHYVVFWLRQAVIRYRENCGSSIRIPSRQRNRIVRYVKVMNDFRISFGRAPSAEELSAALELSPKQVNDLKLDVRLLSMESLNVLIGDKEDTELIDMLPAEQDLEEEATDKRLNEELRTALEEAIDLLKDQEQQVIRSRFFDNATQKEIANSMKVSAQRISEIEKKALRSLRTGKRAAILRPYVDIYGLSLKGSLSRYKNTGISSTEYAAFKLMEFLPRA